ncbi:MAG: EamA family transporter [Sphingobacteriales bacterium]|nr:EamA family transporter [Sphingobacteriales bacterium]
MKNNILAWLILCILVLVWGTSFLLIKKAIIFYSPVETGLLRVSFAFLLFLPFVWKQFRKVTFKQTMLCFLSGAVGIATPAILFAWAETGIDSATAGVLNSLTTLFTLIIGLLFFKTRTRWYNVVGVMIGLAGAVGLISVSGGNDFQFNFHYAMMVLMATICYAFNTNVVKTWLKEVDPVSITVFSVFFTGIITSFILLFFTEFIPETIQSPEKLEGIGYIAILGMIGTGISMLLFNRLIKMTTAVFAASVTYLMPIVALMWGIWDGEKIGLTQFLWIFLILAGVLLVNTRQSKWLKRLGINP